MRVSAFIEPCLPSPADRPPSGADWVYEIKLEGFRMMVRRNPAGVRLLTRNGYDWTGFVPPFPVGRGSRFGGRRGSALPVEPNAALRVLGVKVRQEPSSVS